MAKTADYTLKGHQIEAHHPGSGLFVVATPIGNLDDMTLRGLEVLAGADLIACEDTRVTSKLTRHYGISTPLTAYHDHNAARARPRLLAALGEGRAVALVSDAGTPLISDPGYKLVRAAVEAGHPVTAIPGASAVMAGLATAGLPTDSFLFAGFLSSKLVARKRRIEELKTVPATLVLFEAPSRLAATLADLAEGLGHRPAVVARELTKRFEDVRRGSLAALAEGCARDGPPKGEIVLVIAPPVADLPPMEAAEARLREVLTAESVSRAAALVAEETGLPRRALYQKALELDRGDRS